MPRRSKASLPFLVGLLAGTCSGCSDDATGSASEGVLSQSDSDVPTSSSASSTSTTTTTDATTVATGPEELPCQPNPAWKEGVICLPKTGTACGPCDAACLDSPQANALAEDLWGTDLCCFYDGRTELCGPAVSDGQCCYAIAITGCGCDS